jgi:hypothetical protein
MKYIFGYTIILLIFLISEIHSQDFNPLNTKWIFQEEYGIGPGIGTIEYSTYKIIDTVSSQGRKIFVFWLRDSFYLEDGKMYFWDEGLQSYEMHYDFNSTSNYEIKYWDIFRRSIQIAQVKIDSVFNTIINSDTIPTQLLRITNSGSYENDYMVKVYKNIGASEQNIKLYLGYGLWDPNPITTKLRCFQTDTSFYNFQSYPCDSIWHITNTINPIPGEFIIVPNPTDGCFTILSEDKKDYNWNLNIYTVEGKKIKSLISKTGELICIRELKKDQFYFISLKNSNRVKKIFLKY